MARLDPDEYVNNVLGPTCSKVAHEDSAPQLPASIMIAQAIKECGFDDSTFGKWNVFNIRYAPSISELGNDDGWCAFSSLENACRAYIKNMKAGLYDDAISKLKPKLEDDTVEDKIAYFAALLPIYAPSVENDTPQYLIDVKSFINDYDLFKWDDPRQAGAKVDNKLMGRIAKQMGSEGGGTGGAASRSSDKGFKFIPHGDTVEVIKLPENRTYCEPIYPDYITVSDTVPKWVLDTGSATKDEPRKRDNYTVASITEPLADAKTYERA